LMGLTSPLQIPYKRKRPADCRREPLKSAT